MRNLKTYTRATGNQTGFTIVELLIVVVVIAILASITIISYNGIINRAHQSKLISDVASAGMLMSVDQSSSGIYPATRTAVNNGKGINDDTDVKYNFYSAPTTFCITGVSSHAGVKNYYVSDKNLSPLEGSCPQDLGANVATFAGSGVANWADGQGTAAILMSPSGLVGTPTGELYFTDSASSRVRKVTTSGAVTTIAGGAGSGTADGGYGVSRFFRPQGVTVGPSNQIFVADTDNHRIRSVNLSTNQTAILAGTTQGDLEGAGIAAKFNVPIGIVYDPIRNMVIVADSQSHRIRQVSLSGDMTTLSGQQATGGLANGTGTAAKFNYPRGLAIDSSGTIYVADSLNHAIRKISPSGVVSTFAGGGTSTLGVAGSSEGVGTSARFRNPTAVTVDSTGNVYVADTGNNRIRKITPDGTVSAVAGSATDTAGYADGIKNEALFNGPTGIAIGSDGRLYVADTANNRLRVITNF